VVTLPAWRGRSSPARDDRRRGRYRVRAGGAAGIGNDDHHEQRGLAVADIRIATKAGEIPGYCARPAKPKGAAPVVLVVHEIFGVHEHIRDVCRRFAKLGYLAVAPDLFARQGDVSKIADSKEIVAKVASKVPDEQIVNDLDGTVAWAKRKTATRNASRSRDFAGAAASYGFTPRTAPRSKRASRGTGGWSATRTRFIRSSRSTSRRR
jgi:dienelactone hydrolase